MRNLLSCREAVRLMLRDEDEQIGSDDRMAVQGHVRVCYMCARFVGQLNLLRRATAAWRALSAQASDEPRG